MPPELFYHLLPFNLVNQLGYPVQKILYYLNLLVEYLQETEKDPAKLKLLNPENIFFHYVKDKQICLDIAAYYKGQSDASFEELKSKYSNILTDKEFWAYPIKFINLLLDFTDKPNSLTSRNSLAAANSEEIIG